MRPLNIFTSNANIKYTMSRFSLTKVNFSIPIWGVERMRQIATMYSRILKDIGDVGSFWEMEKNKNMNGLIGKKQKHEWFNGKKQKNGLCAESKIDDRFC